MFYQPGAVPCRSYPVRFEAVAGPAPPDVSFRFIGTRKRRTSCGQPQAATAFRTRRRAACSWGPVKGHGALISGPFGS